MNEDLRKLSSTQPSMSTKQQRRDRADDWTLVQNKKHLRNRFAGKKGKANSQPDSKFKADIIKIPFYIYNVDKDAPLDDIQNYIKNKTGIVVTLESVIMKQKKGYAAYKFYNPKDKLSVLWMRTYGLASLKRSIGCVRHLSLSAQVLALQEHWLREDEIPELGNINRDFGFFGKSAMDTSKGILRGRPYGGVALLWDNNRFDRASVIAL
ncbi:unnamed protein product [Leptidea sinapis]|uniref:Uncharacterized protein n=1 Tax=Leptidea sinapis TaxID=189913 RepID=A0A5E4PWM5_9NEOP|nr:unnamed protein product [Leptidea sinapis]